MKRFHFLLIFVSILVGATIVVSVFGVSRPFVATLIGVALFLLYGYFSLTLEDIGAAKVSRQAVVWSVTIIGSLFAVLGLVYLVSPGVFMDERYNQSLSKTLLSVFVLLPLTTVILEEFMFRGVLLGYLLKTGSRRQALVISSVLFGLWHIATSFDVHVGAVLFIHNPPQLLIGIAIVIVTGLAGLIFSLLRLKTDSILVSIAAHWSINASGIIFAFLAWHR